MRKIVSTIVFILLPTALLLAQFNPIRMSDYAYPSSSIIPASNVNVGVDYQGNSFGANWYSVAVVDNTPGSYGATLSTSYLNVSSGTTKSIGLATPILTAHDPDVVLFGNKAAVVYYRINGSNVEIDVDIFSNINNPTLTANVSSTIIASFPLHLGFVPFVNIDANKNGDWAITYSESSTVAWAALGNGIGSITTPSFFQITNAPAGEYVEPDIAIDDAGKAYVVALDQGMLTLNVINVTGGTSSLVFSSGVYSQLHEPRIACPEGANNTTDWAAVVADADKNVELFYGVGTAVTNQTLTNGTASLGTLGYTIIAAPGGNSRPIVSYNLSGCNTLSVNWYNTFYGGIIGLEIETNLVPFNSLRDFYGPQITTVPGIPLPTSHTDNWFIPVGLGTDASAVCGRYADVKDAAYVSQSKLWQHQIDCTGSWRIGKPHNSLSVIQSKASSNTGFVISPNPATSNLILKMAEDVALTNAEIKIENIVGQVFSTIQLEKNATEQNINIDELPNGIYFIKVISNNKITRCAFSKY